MTTKAVRFYNFEKVKLIIGGLIIGEFDEDGGIEFEFNSDLNEPSVGADGTVTISHLNDNMVTATITLKETSRSYRDLADLVEVQVALQRAGTLGAVPFGCIDPITGDEIFEDKAIFLNRPTPSKAKMAGAREFRVLLPYAGDNIAFGELITNV